ncbi:methyltransferase [Trueperella pyogenes]|uniref:class I SAM-dependent RNA methyltransferase n=1 Tax=Trueperella pyogenes TaxID=1661 RepID=UPI003245179B
MRLTITDIGHGGVGIGRYDGRVVFVRGAIPGEIVDVALTAQQSKFWTAVVTDVVEPSPYRVEHPWREGGVGVTGAADFGHISREGQRALKTDVILNNLRRIGGEALRGIAEDLGLEVADVDDDGWGSRTRIDVVKLERGFGMYREKTNELVPISAMPLAVLSIEKLLFDSPWDGAIAPGTRVHVVSPASGADIVVADRVYTAPGQAVGPYIWERATTQTRVFDYRIFAGGFWQVHTRAPSVLLRAVMEAAKVRKADTVLELFSGAGLFTLPLAQAVGETGSVSAIEGSARAVEDARFNLANTPWANVRVQNIDDSAVRGQRADVVVADPPRAGLGKKLAAQLARMDARIVLVSCDPAAMARDVAELVKRGRRVESWRAFDIFPHTHHVEVVTCLS